MPFEASVEGEELIQTQTRQEERNSKTHRVDCEQKDSLNDRLLRTCHGQNAREDWTDAGCPSKCKGKTQNQCSRHATRLFNVVKTLVLVEEIDFDNSQQVNSEDDDDQSGKPVQEPHP